MNNNPDLRETRPVARDLSLQLRAGDHPVLVQGGHRIRVDLASAKVLAAALTDAAADLAELLAAGGRHHA